MTTQSSVIWYKKIIQINVDQSMYNFKAHHQIIDKASMLEWL